MYSPESVHDAQGGALVKGLLVLGDLVHDSISQLVKRQRPVEAQTQTIVAAAYIEELGHVDDPDHVPDAVVCLRFAVAAVCDKGAPNLERGGDALLWVSASSLR